MRSRRAQPALLFTCEHGGNRIPLEYRSLFRGQQAALHSHRGYDPGALTLARDFASSFHAPLVYSTTSRLLVELNRSPHHPAFFSKVTRELPPDERERIKMRYYAPYRTAVEKHVAKAVANGKRVLHLSCHSFTPRLDGIVRRADIGLLYDPRRSSELRFALAWQEALRTADPRLVVRRNYPYRGSADGLTTHLRRIHGNNSYSGIEIEVNQKHVQRDARAWRALCRLIATTFKQALTQAFP